MKRPVMFAILCTCVLTCAPAIVQASPIVATLRWDQACDTAACDSGLDNFTLSVDDPIAGAFSNVDLLVTFRGDTPQDPPYSQVLPYLCDDPLATPCVAAQQTYWDSPLPWGPPGFPPVVIGLTFNNLNAIHTEVPGQLSFLDPSITSLTSPNSQSFFDDDLNPVVRALSPTTLQLVFDPSPADLTPVPEPTSLALLGTGVAAAMIRRRRSRKSASAA